MEFITSILANLLLLFTSVIYCDKKPLYQESSKEVFVAGTSLDKDALFGYSITYQTKRKTIVIGAPKADIQGQVFECNTTLHNTCSQLYITIDPKPKNHTQFWFGAAACAGSEFFMTCAPRHSYKINGCYQTRSQCFYQSAETGRFNKKPIELQDDEKIKSNRFFFSETTSTEWACERRFDTMGWSMDVSSDDVTIVGGPGATTGRAMLIPKRKNNRPQLIDLRRNNSDPDALVLYNFGYSVKAGMFLGTEVYAISSPYGAMGQGKVLFYSKEREYIQAIVDDDVGSIFGAALCGARLGASDEALLVGAPAAVARARGDRDELDVGAVYVYLYEAGKMQRKRAIRGYKNKGYFGYAITNVGDLNLDGRDEVVISAPYENEYRGAVYIFSGADLLKDLSAPVQWLQRVEGGAPAHMLGLALSAVQDLDGNGCNELSIGLPGNNSALLMKCVAFITFNLNLEENTNRTEEINSTSVLMCLKLTYNEKLEEIYYNVSTLVKLKHPNATLANSENNTLLHNVSLVKSYCQTLQIILPVNGNYDKEMVLQVNASLSGPTRRTSTKFNGLVMLSDETQTYVEKKLLVPGSSLAMNLSTTFSNTSNYIIGSTKSEKLTIVVWNAADSRGGAYAACVRARIRGVGVSRASTHCAPAGGGGGGGGGDAFTCVPSEPILAGNTTNSTMTLDTESLTGEMDFIEIEAKLFKRCDDSPHLVKSMIIPLQKDVNITVSGESIPSAVLNVSKEELDFGYEKINHIYSIINRGMTRWEKLNCIVSIPPYVSYNVSMDSHRGECKKDLIKKETTCVLDNLAGHTKRGIIVSMDVLPNTHFTEKVNKGEANIETQLSCMIAGENRIQRTTTTMKLLHTAVPMWIYVVAVVIGLLVLLIMAFVLYECGFLQRKHKDQLEALIKNVRRQSIVRRSMRLRETMTEESIDQLLKLDNEEDETDSVFIMEVTETVNGQPEGTSRRVVADIH